MSTSRRGQEQAAKVQPPERPSTHPYAATPQMVPVPVPAPLQWAINTGVTPDGTKVCIVQLTQGTLTAMVQLIPHDMKRLAADLRQAAAQSETALILPASVGLNGHH